jgi:hypothetical protein
MLRLRESLLKEVQDVLAKEGGSCQVREPSPCSYCAHWLTTVKSCPLLCMMGHSSYKALNYLVSLVPFIFLWRISLLGPAFSRVPNPLPAPLLASIDLLPPSQPMGRVFTCSSTYVYRKCPVLYQKS